ncbi:DUF2514 family protein [Cupriavidus necator]|uniref:DUF2514 family protein n=1 Tax=Cupriavidus necator TaxID=106590 RepID=UPI0009C0AC87
MNPTLVGRIDASDFEWPRSVLPSWRACRSRSSRWQSASASRSQAAGDPIDVLSDVLGRTDARAGELAKYADSARTAAQACERAYMR